MSLANEAMNIEQFEVASAVHNSGGIVIAQVDKIVQNGSIPAKEVFLHGFMVDYVVEGKPEYSRQSFATDAFRPEIAGLAKVPSTGFEPLAMGPRKICCRRAAMELRPGSLINLGIGMPGGIGSVAQEEGLSDLFTLSMECGPLARRSTQKPCIAWRIFYSSTMAVHWIWPCWALRRWTAGGT